eukprot:COSAG04_NODE_845_length_9916_cov_16.855455_7_plen_84_part_00
MIAKNVYGCTVIGSAGGPEKCAHVCKEFGFDHCVDYRACETTNDLIRALRSVMGLGPGDMGLEKGIDMYFENVGGTYSAKCFS